MDMQFRPAPTPEEVADAKAAQEDVVLVREDNTLTKAGILYVSDARRLAAKEKSGSTWMQTTGDIRAERDREQYL